MECDDNRDLYEKLEPDQQIYTEVERFAIDFAKQNKIEVNKEKKERIQHVISRYRICRCKQCNDFFSGGLISCNAGQGQVEKKDLICPKCAGQTCETHGENAIVLKCEFCCSVANW